MVTPFLAFGFISSLGAALPSLVEFLGLNLHTRTVNMHTCVYEHSRRLVGYAKRKGSTPTVVVWKKNMYVYCNNLQSKILRGAVKLTI